MSPADQTPPLPYRPMVLVALIQGLALLLLHQAIELDFWPDRQPQWLFAFYSLAVAVPTLLLLSLGDGNRPVVLKGTAGFAAILLVLGYYMGRQATPLEHIAFGPLLAAMVATLVIAAFKALMYIQHFAVGGPLTYARLFGYSWRNFLTLGLALLFTLCFWAVLMLWAALFQAIDVDFFWSLFTERWFFYPVLALALGFGVIIFRQLSQVIDTARRISQALIKFLLVILVFVSMIFLASLLATGLQPLWDSGGSLLILGMQAVMLFFLNAVYQDDPQVRPYPLWLHRFIYLGVALLPIYSLISFYGLSLRVDQYGWTVMRCWAFLLWGLFLLFSVGYLWGIVQQRDDWLERVSWVNVRMGLVVLVLMGLVNSPLLDFRKITVASQLARLESGAMEPADLDLRYFRYELARPGYEALQRLKTRWAESEPRILMQIEALYADQSAELPSVSRETFRNAVEILQGEVPEAAFDAIYASLGTQPGRLGWNRGFYLLPLDMNADGNADYLLVEEVENWLTFTLFYQQDGAWVSRDLRTLSSLAPEIGNTQQVIDALRSGNFQIQAPVWQELHVEGRVLTP